jgi:hypothetical protein
LDGELRHWGMRPKLAKRFVEDFCQHFAH